MTGPRRAGLGLTVCACLLGATLTATTAASDEGMAAADEVSYSSYYDYLDLWLYTHTGDNKGPSGPELIPCRDNIATLMQSYGLDVTLEPFTYGGGTYHNVVGTKLGTLYPDQEYVIGAHYDTVSNPGADDNASGVALVLECARIITQYDSDYTIRFRRLLDGGSRTGRLRSLRRRPRLRRHSRHGLRRHGRLRPGYE